MFTSTPDPTTIDAYLGRLGLTHDDVSGADAAALHLVHTRHMENVPYENVDPYLGRLTGLDPVDVLARITRGRGGYCYHLNTALGTLLTALGFDVEARHAGCWVHSQEVSPGVNRTHLGLVVHGVPSADNPAGDWMVDAGFGDGFWAPLPLRAGEWTQGPYTSSLAPSALTPGGWTWSHDPAGAFYGAEIAPAPGADEPPVASADFAEWHTFFSTDLASSFRRVCEVYRRDAESVDQLVGLRYRHITADGVLEVLLDDRATWADALVEVFGLDLSDLSDDEHDELWRRLAADHAGWLATREAPAQG